MMSIDRWPLTISHWPLAIGRWPLTIGCVLALVTRGGYGFMQSIEGSV